MQLSHTRFAKVLRQMMLWELQKFVDHNSTLKIKPTFYVLSPNVEMLKRLEVFGNPKTDVYKRIYQKVLLHDTLRASYGFQLMENSERDLNSILSKLGIKKSDLKPVSIDQQNNTILDQQNNSLYQKWVTSFDKKHILGLNYMIIKTNFIYTSKIDANILIAIMNVSGRIDETTKPDLVSTEYSYVIKGFSIQEFMEN